MKRRLLRCLSILAVMGIPIIGAPPAYAQSEGVNQVVGFIQSIINVGSAVVGSIAALIFLIGGYIFITSMGDAGRLDTAKRTMLYSCIGLAIVIGAFVISNTMTGLATNSLG